MPKNGTFKFQENIRYVNLILQHFSSTFWEKRTFINDNENYGLMNLLVTSDARYFIVKIKCHCDFIIVFWANSYFIFQMHHAKIFKMRYSRSLYKLFWKYESWFCSEVSKTHFTKYPWNHAFAGMKKNTLTNNIS